MICFLAGLQQCGFGAAFDQFHETHREKFDLDFSGFDAREFQQIVGKARETHGVVADDFAGSGVVLGIVERAAEKRFGESLNGGERRLEFVRDVGDEILANSFEPAKFSDVMQHDDGAGRFPGGDGGRTPRSIRAGSFERVTGAAVTEKFASGRCPWRFRFADLLRRAGLGGSARAIPNFAPLQLEARPSPLEGSTLKISENARLQKTIFPARSTTATPSTMLRRMALERLRSPLSEANLAFHARRGLVQRIARGRRARRVALPGRRGRKSPSAMRREKFFRRPTRAENEPEKRIESAMPTINSIAVIPSESPAALGQRINGNERSITASTAR